MADKPTTPTLLPTLLEQNPAPVGGSGQDRITTRREQVDSIMSVFMQVLPSNYVAQVQGPFYTVQFQAAAEAIADFQITAQEAFSDSDYDFMRGEFLFQLLGSLVFPDASSDGYPTLKGDLTYREFLKRMVLLLLQGATKDTVESGLELLSDATFAVIEKVIAARDTKKRVFNEATGSYDVVPGSAWGLDDQFEFEINVTHVDPTTGLQRLPEEPFVLSEHASGPVFVYFWASSCAPCEAEAPMIQSLWPEYEALGYTFVGINIWNVEAEARAFIERHDITFPTVIDDGETYLDYGVYAVPEAFFLLPGLEVNAKYIGELSEDAFRERLAEIEPPS